MLQLDYVRELVSSGIDEIRAIKFMAANAATVRQTAPRDRAWASRVKQLDERKGPGDQSLFQLACADPAVFWLVAHDNSSDHSKSERILAQYGGTELPAILLKYWTESEPKLLQAATDAIVRFDVESDPEQAKRQAAAQFLNRYQDDSVFKGLLLTHGPVLIPALSAGGPDALAQISKNPADIHKWVDDEGKPRGTPLWTYAPGGNIVYAIREKINGRTLTWGELGWATVDLVTVASLAGPIINGATSLVAAGGEATGKSLIEAAGEAAGKDTVVVVLENTAKDGSLLAAKTTARIGVLAEASTLLKSAGIVVVEASLTAIRVTASWVGANPMKSVVIAVVALSAVYPNKAGEVGARIAEVLVDAVRRTAKTLGVVAAAAPGKLIEGMWEEIQRLADAHPMLWWIYDLLFVCLLAIVILVPILLLKKLLYPVYALLKAVVWTPIRGLNSKFRPRADSAI